MTEKDKCEWRGIGVGLVAGFLLTATLNTLPFADAEKYRRAIKQCEKSLPRDQDCIVVGVPDPKP